MPRPNLPSPSPKPLRKIISPGTVAGFVLAAVLLGSFLPARDKRALHSEGRFHSWGHLAVFAVVGFVASRAARSPKARGALLFGALLFGLAIEVGEHLVFHNPLEWKDVLVDSLGVVAGTLLAAAVAR